jgi:hypothetical protein
MIETKNQCGLSNAQCFKKYAMDTVQPKFGMALEIAGKGLSTIVDGSKNLVNGICREISKRDVAVTLFTMPIRFVSACVLQVPIASLNLLSLFAKFTAPSGNNLVKNLQSRIESLCSLQEHIIVPDCAKRIIEARSKQEKDTNGSGAAGGNDGSNAGKASDGESSVEKIADGDSKNLSDEGIKSSDVLPGGRRAEVEKGVEETGKAKEQFSEIEEQLAAAKGQLAIAKSMAKGKRRLKAVRRACARIARIKKAEALNGALLSEKISSNKNEGTQIFEDLPFEKRDSASQAAADDDCKGENGIFNLLSTIDPNHNPFVNKNSDESPSVGEQPLNGSDAVEIIANGNGKSVNEKTFDPRHNPFV